MLGHSIYLKKLKKTEIISSIFFNHNSMKSEIHNMKKIKIVTNMEKLTYNWITNGLKEKSTENKKTKISNKQPNLISRKSNSKDNYLKVSRKKETTKMRAGKTK